MYLIAPWGQYLSSSAMPAPKALIKTTNGASVQTIFKLRTVSIGGGGGGGGGGEEGIEEREIGQTSSKGVPQTPSSNNSTLRVFIETFRMKALLVDKEGNLLEHSMAALGQSPHNQAQYHDYDFVWEINLERATKEEDNSSNNTTGGGGGGGTTHILLKHVVSERWLAVSKKSGELRLKTSKRAPPPWKLQLVANRAYIQSVLINRYVYAPAGSDVVRANSEIPKVHNELFLSTP